MRVPPRLLLREDEDAVALHVEDAAASLEKVDLRVGVARADLGSQTGGPRLVVSDDAISDRDVHVRFGGSWSRWGKFVQGGTATPARLAS
jgi:hypothetical protein